MTACYMMLYDIVEGPVKNSTLAQCQQDQRGSLVIQVTEEAAVIESMYTHSTVAALFCMKILKFRSA